MDGALFSQLVLKHHQRMRMVVLAIAPGCDEVDDVLQESCAAMWQKMGQFDAQREFAPWALQFVRWQTMAWLKRKGRDRLRLSNDTVHVLCDSIGQEDRFQQQRVEALEFCLGGLSEDEQLLMAKRFVEGVSVQDIARETQGKTADTLYKTFTRLRVSLLRCISSKLQEGNA